MFFFFTVYKCHNLNQRSKILKIFIFLWFKKKNCPKTFLNTFQVFFTILVTMAAPHFFCILTLLNSIPEPNNQVFVLGATNERQEAHCDARMYVCMCLKGSVNYGQAVRVFVFFHWTKLVNMVFKILNIKGQLNCMIGSKVTTILPVIPQKLQLIQTQACGVCI